MQQSLTKLIMLIMLVISLAAPSSIVQGIAWASMITSNLQSNSISETLTKTFISGKPCEICLVAGAMKKDEQSSEKKTPSDELDVKKSSPEDQSVSVNLPDQRTASISLSDSGEKSYLVPVPVPPPRA